MRSIRNRCVYNKHIMPIYMYYTATKTAVLCVIADA